MLEESYACLWQAGRLPLKDILRKMKVLKDLIVSNRKRFP